MLPTVERAYQVADTNPVRRRLERSLEQVIAWVQSHHYRAYEPADGNSSVLFPLTMGQVLPMRVLQQIVLRAPLNIRPVLRVRPHESAIARGYMAWGYLVRSRKDTSNEFRDEARTCLDWLIANRATAYEEFCWGDPYEYATRSGRRPYGEPLLIWSALIGQAFLDAFDVLQDARYLEVAESVGRWVLRLPLEQTTRGVCLSYVPYRHNSIHNANVMGAAFLARLGRTIGSERHLALARKAMLYTCIRQRPDGSWWYADEPQYHWIDSFHSGYNLSALSVYRTWTNDASFDEQFAAGARFFRSAFFEADGRPKYFHDRTYPIDIQCAAQGIETLTLLADHWPDAFALALQVADWTITNMQASDGHFHYRDLGWITVQTPMLHWGQATMVKALAVALERLNGHA
jgi:hypothetical protein